MDAASDRRTKRSNSATLNSATLNSATLNSATLNSATLNSSTLNGEAWTSDTGNQTDPGLRIMRSATLDADRVNPPRDPEAYSFRPGNIRCRASDAALLDPLLAKIFWRTSSIRFFDASLSSSA